MESRKRNIFEEVSMRFPDFFHILTVCKKVQVTK